MATGGTFFNYVFNYTDHLGNVRLSWAWDDKNEGLKILEESHYYPFGLKHRAYNTDQYSFVPPVNGVPGYAVRPLNNQVVERLKIHINITERNYRMNWD